MRRGASPRVRRPDAWTALLLGALLLATGALLLWASPHRAPLLGMLGVELVAGREAALPTGIALGLPWTLAALANVWTEWTMLLLGFPLLALAGDRLLRVPRIEALFHRARAFAHARPNVGVLALGGLTLAPFLPIGALTSVLVGEILGLPQRRLVPILLLAEVAANVTYAYAASAVAGLFPDPRLVAALGALALLLVAAVGAWAGRRA